jgi:hypothetical protein
MMKIKAFKNISLGKLKHKPNEDNPRPNDTTNEQIIVTKEKRLEPSDNTGEKIPIDNMFISPRRPAGELTIDLTETNNIGVIDLDKALGSRIDEPGEPIRITKISPTKADDFKNWPTAKFFSANNDLSKIMPDDNASFKSLFSNQEEEDNPLTNLTNSLPDVSAGEIIDDLNEIQRMLKKWKSTPQKSMPSGTEGIPR